MTSLREGVEEAGAAEEGVRSRSSEEWGWSCSQRRAAVLAPARAQHAGDPQAGDPQAAHGIMTIHIWLQCPLCLHSR